MRPPICDKTAPPHLENPGSATEEEEDKLRNTKTAAVLRCKQLQQKCEMQKEEMERLREKIKRFAEEVS